MRDAIKNSDRLTTLEAPGEARGLGIGGIQFRAQNNLDRSGVIVETDDGRLAGGAHRVDNSKPPTGILIFIPHVGTLESVYWCQKTPAETGCGKQNRKPFVTNHSPRSR